MPDPEQQPYGGDPALSRELAPRTNTRQPKPPSPAERLWREQTAKLLREPGAHVLHVPSLVCAEVTEVFEPEQFRDVNGNPINAHVVGLASGDAFLLASDTVVPLAAHEREFFQALVGELSAAVSRAVASKGGGLDPASLVHLVRAALAQQKRALDRQAEEVPPA